jgi:hypothetical protein
MMVQYPSFNVRVRQCDKLEHCSSPLSGHSWYEPIPLKKWEVVGAVGVIATANSLEKAEKIRAEHQAFYDKFFK